MATENRKLYKDLKSMKRKWKESEMNLHRTQEMNERLLIELS